MSRLHSIPDLPGWKGNRKEKRKDKGTGKGRKQRKWKKSSRLAMARPCAATSGLSSSSSSLTVGCGNRCYQQASYSHRFAGLVQKSLTEGLPRTEWVTSWGGSFHLGAVFYDFGTSLSNYVPHQILEKYLNSKLGVVKTLKETLVWLIVPWGQRIW